MQEYSHKCLRCSTEYKDDDPDPYYCKDCIEVRKKIAQRIDNTLKFQGDTNRSKSDLQAFEESAIKLESKSGGFSYFMRAK